MIGVSFSEYDQEMPQWQINPCQSEEETQNKHSQHKVKQPALFLNKMIAKPRTTRKTGAHNGSDNE